MVQYSTVKYSKVEYSTTKYSTVQYGKRYSCQILIKFVFYRQIFEKFSTIKFHEFPSSASRVVPCGRTDGQTDMAKLIITFRSFSEASKTGYFVYDAT